MSEYSGLFPPGSSVFDVTAPIRPGMAVWPGDPAVAFAPVLRMSDGEEANVSRISLSTHVGTHVDAPWHFVVDGPTLDQIPIERWIGPCAVVDVPAGIEVIEQEVLATTAGLTGTKFVILKTRPDDGSAPASTAFDPAFAALSLGAARWLVDRGVNLVGVDTPSVEAVDGDGEVHRELLRAGTLIVEGLELAGVPPGSYTLVCLPLKLAGADGAPARVLLVKDR